MESPRPRNQRNFVPSDSTVSRDTHSTALTNIVSLYPLPPVHTRPHGRCPEFVIPFRGLSGTAVPPVDETDSFQPRGICQNLQGPNAFDLLQWVGSRCKKSPPRKGETHRSHVSVTVLLSGWFVSLVAGGGDPPERSHLPPGQTGTKSISGTEDARTLYGMSVVVRRGSNRRGNRRL